MAWLRATSSASSRGAVWVSVRSTRSRGMPVRAATVSATRSAGADGGRPSRSAMERRRSSVSSPAAWPRPLARWSRLPTATTSSAPGSWTGWGSATGRPSRRALQRASSTNATTSCHRARRTRGAIRSPSPALPPPGRGGCSTWTLVPSTGTSRLASSTALSASPSSWLTSTLAPPRRTTVPLPSGWTSSQAPLLRGKQARAPPPSGTSNTTPPGAATRRTSARAASAQRRSSSASSRPMRVEPACSTSVTAELGSATTSVPPCPTQSRTAGRRSGVRSSLSSSAVSVPVPGRSAETRTSPPSSRSTSTSPLVPSGPGDAGSSGFPSSPGRPATATTSATPSTTPTHGSARPTPTRAPVPALTPTPAPRPGPRSPRSCTGSLEDAVGQVAEVGRLLGSGVGAAVPGDLEQLGGPGEVAGGVGQGPADLPAVLAGGPARHLLDQPAEGEVGHRGPVAGADRLPPGPGPLVGLRLGPPLGRRPPPAPGDRRRDLRAGRQPPGEPGHQHPHPEQDQPEQDQPDDPPGPAPAERRQQPPDQLQHPVDHPLQQRPLGHPELGPRQDLPGHLPHLLRVPHRHPEPALLLPLAPCPPRAGQRPAGQRPAGQEPGRGTQPPAVAARPGPGLGPGSRGPG